MEKPTNRFQYWALGVCASLHWGMILNLKIVNIAEPHSLSSKELEIIGKARDIFKGKLVINCTSYGYCLPCPAGVNIPKNFTRHNDYHLFGSPEEKASF